MTEPRRGRRRAARPPGPKSPAGAAARREEDRRRGEIRYQALFEMASDGIGVSDAETRVLDVNRAACEMSGFSRDEVIGRRAGELFVPEDLEAQPLDVVSPAAGRVVRRVRRMWRKDGSFFIAETSTTALPDGRILTVIRDITERVEAERRLAEGEARLAAVVEHADVGITVTDAGWRFIEANPRACEIFGHARKELLGMRVFDLAKSGDPGVSEADREALRAGRVVRGVRRLRRPDGTERTVEISARSLADGSVVSIVTDVTERTEGARLLAESERHLESAQELAHFGTYEVDVASGRITWSREMYRITGVPMDGQPMTFERFAVCGHPEDGAMVAKGFRDALAGRPVPNSREFRIRRPDGSVRMVLGTMEVQRDATGKPLRMVGSLQDITEQRLLEAQLREAQKLEAIGRLAGGVAHDFNNLLTVILGFVETMLDGMGAEDRQRGAAEQIRLAARRAAALTQQLLAFGRRQMFRLEVFDLNVVLGEMEEILRPLIGEQIEISVSPGARRALIRADRGQIEQVVLNLALNARDAMPAGGRLDIVTANADPPAGWPGEASSGPCLLLTVSDTGIGMSPEVQAHIFEPFYTTKDVGRGTGLGLATVHGIVSETGGHITVESAPGRGARFLVHLPCAADETTSDAGPPAVAQDCGDETVLLVEDDAAVRGLVAQVLRRRGYRVLEAADGSEAELRLAGHPGPLHLLVTDVVMPGVGGRDLARRLLEARPGLRVLLISGYSGERAGASGLDAVSVAFLQKPFSPATLAQKVREVLDRPPGPPAAGGPDPA